MSDTTNDKAEGFSIDVVSDAVCPWCFIGKRRLEVALASLPDLTANIHWRPFQLDATIPRGGISREQYLTNKFGPDRARDMHARLEEAGRGAGIAFAFDKILRSPNTLDAHRLIRWSQGVGAQTDVVERLFNLYFIEGGDIGDRDVLTQVAGEHGLDRGKVRQWLDADVDLAAVNEEIAVAQRLGVGGVPFFIFDGRFAVSGAQPPEAIAEAIRKTLETPVAPDA